MRDFSSLLQFSGNRAQQLTPNLGQHFNAVLELELSPTGTTYNPNTGNYEPSGTTIEKLRARFWQDDKTERSQTNDPGQDLRVVKVTGRLIDPIYRANRLRPNQQIRCEYNGRAGLLHIKEWTPAPISYNAELEQGRGQRISGFWQVEGSR